MPKRKKVYGTYPNLQQTYKAILRLVGLGYRKENLYVMHVYMKGNFHKPPVASILGEGMRNSAQEKLLQHASVVCDTDTACRALFHEDESNLYERIEPALSQGSFVIITEGRISAHTS